MAKPTADSKHLAAPKRQRTGMVQFFRESIAELKRIRWPKQKEVAGYTTAVVITCLAMGVLVWLFDIGVAKLMSLIGLV